MRRRNIETNRRRHCVFIARRELPDVVLVVQAEDWQEGAKHVGDVQGVLEGGGVDVRYCVQVQDIHFVG